MSEKEQILASIDIKLTMCLQQQQLEQHLWLNKLTRTYDSSLIHSYTSSVFSARASLASIVNAEKIPEHKSHYPDTEQSFFWTSGMIKKMLYRGSFPSCHQKYPNHKQLRLFHYLLKVKCVINSKIMKRCSAAEMPCTSELVCFVKTWTNVLLHGHVTMTSVAFWKSINCESYPNPIYVRLSQFAVFDCIQICSHIWVNISLAPSVESSNFKIFLISH